MQIHTCARFIAALAILTMVGTTACSAQTGNQKQTPPQKRRPDLAALRANFTRLQRESQARPAPRGNEADFAKKLAAWGEAHARLQQARRELFVELLRTWAKAGPKDAAFANLSKEIEAVTSDSPTAGFRSFCSYHAWRVLSSKGVSPAHAALLANVSKPSAGSGFNDLLASLGATPEPWEWDLQATHALALYRGGQKKKAQRQLSSLTRKVSSVHKRHPGSKLDFGEEAGAARHRDVVDFMQVSLLLQAIVATPAEDAKTARALVVRARKLRPDFGPEAKLIAREAARQPGPKPSK